MRRKHNTWSVRLCVAILVWIAALPCHAQRHLPDIQVFESLEMVRLDTVVEHPAVDNGIAIAKIPQPGETLTIQIFVPRAGGLTAFECVVELDADAIADAFRVASVKDWLNRDIQPLASKSKPTYYLTRLMPILLPENGHIATLELSPLRILQNPLPIPIACFITVISTPPRRIWQMRGAQPLTWQ